MPRRHADPSICLQLFFGVSNTMGTAIIADAEIRDTRSEGQRWHADRQAANNWLYGLVGIATLVAAGTGALILHSLPGSPAVSFSSSVAQAPHALSAMSQTSVAATPIDPTFLASLATEPNVLAFLSLDPTCTSFLVVVGGATCVVAADKLKKYIKENQEEKLKNAIPGANSCGDKEYILKVMVSLEKYTAQKKGSALEVETFEDFVATRIIETLNIKTFKDLHEQHNIDELSRLKSGATTIIGDYRRELHIDKLEEEFEEFLKNNPPQSVSPGTTISGGGWSFALFNCSTARPQT